MGLVVTETDFALALPALAETLMAAYPELPDEAEYLNYAASKGCFSAKDGAFGVWQDLLGRMFEISASLHRSVVYSKADRAYRVRAYTRVQLPIPSPCPAPVAEAVSPSSLARDPLLACVFCAAASPSLDHFAHLLPLSPVLPHWDLKPCNLIPACVEKPGDSETETCGA